MNKNIAKRILACLTLTVIGLTAATVEAQDSDLTKIATQAARQMSLRKNASSGEIQVRKPSRVDFNGLWAGRFVLVKTTCTGFAPSFLFRHAVQTFSNQVSVQTSHDGLMGGMTRDNGRRLEAGTQYARNNGMFVRAALVYANSSGSSTQAGLGIEVMTFRGRCLAAYGATAIRQFGLFQ